MGELPAPRLVRWLRARRRSGKRTSLAFACGLQAVLLAACGMPSTTYIPPSASRVGYERFEQSYAIWQLLHRAQEATSGLQSWREEDPESGSSWEYALPSRMHFRVVDPDGQVHEGYESEETVCWRREDGRWDRRPIGRRPPVAAALAEDLFSGAVRIFPEGTVEQDGVLLQQVRFSQRAGDRRWSTLARDREVRLWLGVEDALPRRLEVATPNFARPERQSVRLLSHFDGAVDVQPPCG